MGQPSVHVLGHTCRYLGQGAADLRRGRTGRVTAARQVPGRWAGVVTDHIVVGDRVLPDAKFGAARARLRSLARDGMLLRASEAAYGEAITSLVREAGPAAGLTRLAGICLEDRAETGDCAHIALQWEAIAADGTLFIALDAALLLVQGGDRITALTLAGAYRPQPGPAGTGLDQAIERRCVAAAIGSFLDRVACALVHPAGTAGPPQEATESGSLAALQARQAPTAPLTTPAVPSSPPGTAVPGSATSLAAGRGIGYGILDPLVLIFAVSVLLAGLLTGLIPPPKLLDPIDQPVSTIES